MKKALGRVDLVPKLTSFPNSVWERTAAKLRFADRMPRETGLPRPLHRNAVNDLDMQKAPERVARSEACLVFVIYRWPPTSSCVPCGGPSAQTMRSRPRYPPARQGS